MGNHGGNTCLSPAFLPEPAAVAHAGPCQSMPADINRALANAAPLKWRPAKRGVNAIGLSSAISLLLVRLWQKLSSNNRGKLTQQQKNSRRRGRLGLGRWRDGGRPGTLPVLPIPYPMNILLPVFFARGSGMTADRFRMSIKKTEQCTKTSCLFSSNRPPMIFASPAGLRSVLAIMTRVLPINLELEQTIPCPLKTRPGTTSSSRY